MDNSLKQSLETDVYGLNQSTGSTKSDRKSSTGSYQSITNNAIFHNLQEEDMDFALDEDMAPAMPEQVDSSGYMNPAFSGEDEELEVGLQNIVGNWKGFNNILVLRHRITLNF